MADVGEVEADSSTIKIISSTPHLKALDEYDDVTGAEVEAEIIEKEAHWFRLVCVSCFTFGLTFAFNSVFVLGTPLFAKLGMGPFLTSFALLSGPVSGLLQPFVGALSDKTRLSVGRRRPYIAGGMLLGTIGMILFSNPSFYASLFGYKDDTSFEIPWAIVSLWVLYVGLNVAQGPGIALVADLCPQTQQKLGQSIMQAMGAIAGILCNIIGFFNPDILFYVGIGVMFTMIFPVVLAGKEMSLTEIELRKKELNIPDIQISMNPILQIFRAVVHMTAAMRWIVVVFFFSCAAFSPFLFYITDFFGEVVYDGNPQASSEASSFEDYEKGVSMGSFGMGLMQVSTLITSALLPKLQRWCGVKVVLFSGMIIGSICFMSPLIPIIQTLYPAESIMILAGIYNSVSHVIAYSLIGQLVPKQQSGSMFGIMSAVQVIAQMSSNFIASFAMSAYGSVTIGFALGGLFSLLAALFSMFIILPRHAAQSDHSVPQEEDKLV